MELNVFNHQTGFLARVCSQYKSDQGFLAIGWVLKLVAQPNVYWYLYIVLAEANVYRAHVTCVA